MANIPCPCGRTGGFNACCGAVHDRSRPAITAEDLMRSRYSAFAVGDTEYLKLSWDPEQVPAEIKLTRERWTGLTIHGSTAGGAFDAEGTVHFTAHYEDGGESGQQTENSFFRRVGGLWVYVGAS